MRTTDATPDYDVIIVGAGPAGLTAATYLGRFRRKVLILDGGPSRASWIPESHNTPGFPHGVGGPALLADMAQQARPYGAERRRGRARALVRAGAGFELVIDEDGPDSMPLTTRFVLLATGVVDRLPDLPGVEAAIRAAKVRMCPICDAYEAIDQKIAVLGEGELGAREAVFLTTYSKTVTLLHLGPPSTLRQPDAMKAKGVELLPIALSSVSVEPDRIEVAIAGDAPRAFDCLYLALGCDMQSRLAVQWGAAHDAEGNLIVNAHQETSIERLYAAGDVVRGLNQIAVATGEAAIAATDIHKRLRELDG